MRIAGGQLSNHRSVAKRTRWWTPALLLLGGFVCVGVWIGGKRNPGAIVATERSAEGLIAPSRRTLRGEKPAAYGKQGQTTAADVDDWLVEEIKQTNDEALLAVTQDLARLKREFDETLLDFDRSQGVFYNASSVGKAPEQYEADAAHDKGQQILAKLNDIEAQVFEKTSAVIARYYALQTRSLGIE